MSPRCPAKCTVQFTCLLDSYQDGLCIQFLILKQEYNLRCWHFVHGTLVSWNGSAVMCIEMSNEKVKQAKEECWMTSTHFANLSRLPCKTKSYIGQSHKSQEFLSLAAYTVGSFQ